DPPAVGAAPSKWTISGAGANKTVLEPSNPGTDFEKGKLNVVVRDVHDPTFTLTVEWSCTVPNADPSALPGASHDLAFLVDVDAAPPAGYKAPRPGTGELSGGSDASRPG